MPSHHGSTPSSDESPTQSTEFLQYPKDIGNGLNNWINFNSFAFKNRTNPIYSIALYIPGDALATSYKADYESVQLGGLGAVSDKAMSAMTKQGAGTADRLKQIMSATGSGLMSEAGTVTMLKTGEKTNLIAEGTKTIMERSQGAVLNPFSVAAFKGPTEMRTHDFTFTMLPQSVEESSSCMKITRSFRKAMLPSHQGGDSGSAPSMLFGYPDIFEIRFVINGIELPESEENPMFNIGRSVCTGCDLNFATENVPLFFEGTNFPVSIEMKLTFMEIDIMYREKIEEGF